MLTNKKKMRKEEWKEGNSDDAISHIFLNE